ncbi:MAG: hypothetical protein TREMPRED_002407 [Tremellales sp. Tagirdzhanova-0007]|nr:MAG: hypothetical protein TREMPRED_002407 [Tremellales sp. Tagirdzhanova-0007]
MSSLFLPLFAQSVSIVASHRLLVSLLAMFHLAVLVISITILIFQLLRAAISCTALSPDGSASGRRSTKTPGALERSMSADGRDGQVDEGQEGLVDQEDDSNSEAYQLNPSLIDKMASRLGRCHPPESMSDRLMLINDIATDSHDVCRSSPFSSPCLRSSNPSYGPEPYVLAAPISVSTLSPVPPWPFASSSSLLRSLSSPSSSTALVTPVFSLSNSSLTLSSVLALSPAVPLVPPPSSPDPADLIDSPIIQSPRSEIDCGSHTRLRNTPSKSSIHHKHHQHIPSASSDSKSSTSSESSSASFIECRPKISVIDFVSGNYSRGSIETSKTHPTEAGLQNPATDTTTARIAKRKRDGQPKSQVDLPKSSIPLADYKNKTLLLLTYPMSFSQVIQFADVLYKIDGAVSGKTPQYKDLQAMHESYGDKGLVMIGFPCNQVSSVYSDLTLLIRSTSILHTFPGIFPARSCSNPTGVENGQFNGQEPGTDDEVLQFCQLNYGVTFPIAKKVCTPLIDDRRSMLSGLGAMVDACISMQGNVNGPETQPIWKYLKAQATPPVEEIDWNFSKFLVKDGKVKWYAAKTTKVNDVEAAL